VPGEVDDGRPSPANGANGHAAKKRKKQKAMAAVAANGHVGKVAKRKVSGTAGERAGSPGNGSGNGKATHGSVVTDDRTLELPAVEDDDEVGVAHDLDEVAEVAAVDDLEVGHAEELDAERALDAEPPADASRRARRSARARARTPAEPKLRRRAAKRARKLVADPPPSTRAEAVAEPKLRRRAAKRAAAARRETPAGRRAELVATAASIAAAAEESEAASSSKRTGRFGKVVRRVFALIAILMVPGAVYALAVTKGPVSALPQADAAYLSEQLITADQRVRKQLVRLRPLHTSAAIARTRESQLTARSITLELGNRGGSAATRLQRALKLEAGWLDAVGSVLANPSSPLIDALVARDAALRPALAALPSTEGLRRKGGAEHLRDFARSRIAAKRHKRR
jgi:hypothetical protein